MVVGNLHVVCVPILPDETDAVLVVDADAVLPFPGAFQNFQTVAGNRCRVAERSRLIQMDELTERSLFRCAETASRIAAGISFRSRHLDKTGSQVYRISVSDKLQGGRSPSDQDNSWRPHSGSGGRWLGKRAGWANYTFAFHDAGEIGPGLLAQIAKKTGLDPEDL